MKSTKELPSVPKHVYMLDGVIYKCLESNLEAAEYQEAQGVTVYNTPVTRKDDNGEAYEDLRYWVIASEYVEKPKAGRKSLADKAQELRAQGLSDGDILKALGL